MSTNVEAVVEKLRSRVDTISGRVDALAHSMKTLVGPQKDRDAFLHQRIDRVWEIVCALQNEVTQARWPLAPEPDPAGTYTAEHLHAARTAGRQEERRALQEVLVKLVAVASAAREYRRHLALEYVDHPAMGARFDDAERSLDQALAELE